MLCLFSYNKVNIDKIFKRGDFSFIKNKKEKEYLDHDYKAIDNLFLKEGYDRWELLGYNDWYLLSKYLFDSHTEETYNKSIRNLSLIANYGWKIFVIKYPIF